MNIEFTKKSTVKPEKQRYSYENAYGSENPLNHCDTVTIISIIVTIGGFKHEKEITSNIDSERRNSTSEGV